MLSGEHPHVAELQISHAVETLAVYIWVPTGVVPHVLFLAV